LNQIRNGSKNPEEDLVITGDGKVAHDTAARLYEFVIGVEDGEVLVYEFGCQRGSTLEDKVLSVLPIVMHEFGEEVNNEGDNVYVFIGFSC
jgi:hypothetical protein